MLSGSTQRNGMAATFCERWLVIANSRVEAQAASAIHLQYCPAVGLSAASASGANSATNEVPERIAVNAHRTMNTPKPMDHMPACWRVVYTGSDTNGALTCANRDAALGSANSWD